MVPRKLLAALVGLSLATGTLGAASAQTTAPVATRSASPSDTVMPATTAKSDTLKTAPVRKAHHAGMTSKTHRKHVSLRAAKGSKTATKRIASKHVAMKHLGTKVAVKSNANPTGKRIRISHSLKRGSTKHV